MRSGRVRAGICAVLVALGLPFAGPGPQPASAADAAVVPVTGTMQVSQTSVTAGQTTELIFTYTAVFLNDGTITLGVPAGWTPPSQAPGPGFTTVSCATATVAARDCQLAVSAATGTITITNLYLNVDLGRTVVITYEMATAPAAATISTFTAAEQSSPQGTLTGLVSSPTVAVNCPDGSGTMTVSPSAVAEASTHTLIFTYTAGSCGTQPGGAVTLTVPDSWTAPIAASVTAPGVPGSVTSTGGGSPMITGQKITVPTASLGPGGTVSIDYEMARAPTVPAGYTFAAAEESSADGDLVALATSPEMTVTPAGGSGPQTGQSPPPPPPSQAGLMTVHPARVLAAQPSTLTFSYQAPRAGLPPSSEITVDVPAGWTAPSASASPGQPGYARSGKGVLSIVGRQLMVTGVTLAAGQDLTITYAGRAAPSAAGQSTFAASVRSGRAARLTALRASPAVTVALAGVAGAPDQWLVIVLVIGLVAAAALAAVLVRRYIHGPGWPPVNVRAMPHPGAPASVAIRDTGKRPTLTVHIEPHASAVSSTIRKARL
jgi:hypothetical protein